MDADLGMVVKVARGKHVGKIGTVFHKTPQKVRLRMEDGEEAGLIPKTILDLNSSPEKVAAEAAVPAPAVATPAATNPQKTYAEATKSTATAAAPELSPTAYEEPFFFNDPSTVVLTGMLLYSAWDCKSQCIKEFVVSVPMLAAVGLFFFTRTFVAPPRVALTSAQWSSANWYIVVASFLMFKLVAFVAAHGMDLSQISKEDQFRSYTLMAVVLPLCIVCYQSIVQGRPERHAAELVSTTVQILLVGQFVLSKGLDSTDPNSLFGLLKEDGNNEQSPYRVLVSFAAAMVFHSIVTTGLGAWAKIRETFAAVPGSGW